jgi:hypothetical protein
MRTPVWTLFALAAGAFLVGVASATYALLRLGVAA